MNRTASYKSILTLCVLLALSSVTWGKLLKPSENGEKKEILMVSSKRRVYYSVDTGGLTYTLQGPTRVEFISRYPAPDYDKKKKSFEYRILLDNEDTIQVRHSFRLQKSIRSVQHPNHFYTYSGNYFINIPDGQHTITLNIPKDQAYPVLMRALVKDFDIKDKKSKVITPTVHQQGLHLKIDSSDIIYFMGSYAIPLKVNVSGPGILKLYSRLAFENWMGDQESYRIQVQSGKKVIGTYYFTAEKSTNGEILEQPELIPGKWRTCEIEIPKGNHDFTVKVVEKDREVLMRFLEF